MRRLIRCLLPLLAVLGLVVVHDAPAADAHFLPAFTQTVDGTSGCYVASQYGTYGTNGFAMIRLIPGASPYCDFATAVEVTVAINGVVRSQYCSMGAAIDNPTVRCNLTLAPEGITVMAAWPGGAAFAMRVTTVSFVGSGAPTTQIATHGAFG